MKYFQFKCIFLLILILAMVCLLFYREHSETFVNKNKNIEFSIIQKAIDVSLKELTNTDPGLYHVIKVNNIEYSGSIMIIDMMIFNQLNATANRYESKIKIPINTDNEYILDYIRFYSKSDDEPILDNFQNEEKYFSNLSKKYYEAIKEGKNEIIKE